MVELIVGLNIGEDLLFFIKLKKAETDFSPRKL
jgi:hypothetical protein